MPPSARPQRPRAATTGKINHRGRLAAVGTWSWRKQGNKHVHGGGHRSSLNWCTEREHEPPHLRRLLQSSLSPLRCPDAISNLLLDLMGDGIPICNVHYWNSLHEPGCWSVFGESTAGPLHTFIKLFDVVDTGNNCFIYMQFLQ